MFAKFAWFWIKNKQLSFVIVTVFLLAWIFSWLRIPKQYNPDIVVPAFNIFVNAPGYSAIQVNELVLQPLENKLTEIEWVEHVYSNSNRNYGSALVSFFVWTDREDATTRLYNKIMSNMHELPLWVYEPVIQAVDPDEIPIFTIALSYDSIQSWSLNEFVKLRKISQNIIDRFKLINDVSRFYIVGWYIDDINIKLDINKLISYNIDILQVYQVLKKNNMILPIWSLDNAGQYLDITLDGNMDEVEDINKLVIANNNWSIVYLWDVADVYKWYSDDDYYSYFNDSRNGELKKTVYIWVAKKKWSNSVSVVEDLYNEIENIESDLPEYYEINIIQDEWKEAKTTTGMLLINLIQSIFIVIIILTIFLWFKNSLNVAISIPLTLSIIFLFILITWDNVNRITLFALILVLWMLVDDATVVVENVNRHLDMRSKTWKKKLQAIFDAIKEVELGVILSTITRLLAFISMFFVSGMMWLYMWPIPKYAIVAMISSTIVALSINPFLSYVFSGKISIWEKWQQIKYNCKVKCFENIKKLFDKKFNKIKWNKKVKHIFDKTILYYKKINKKYSYFKDTKLPYLKNKFKQKYFDFLHYYLWREDLHKQRRSKFKKYFWIIFFAVLFLPPLLGIFKMRMLPKSNQAQVYMWFDMSLDTSVSQANKFSIDFDEFFKDYIYNKDILKSKENNYTKYDKSLQIVKNINYWVGIAPTPDFSNVFRGSMDRSNPNMISMRVNLVDKNIRNISSEEFVTKIRPRINRWLLNNYPNVRVRLLEDPPWPPVRSTFSLEISGDPSVSYDRLEYIADWINNKLSVLYQKNYVEDVYTSTTTYKTNYNIKLKHDLISRLGLNVEQIMLTLNIMFDGKDVMIYHDDDLQEPSNIVLSVDDKYKDNIDIFGQITFTNSFGKKVYLSEIADFIPTKSDSVIYGNDKLSTVYIYGELGWWSVIYPMLDLYIQMSKKSFWDNKYSFESMDLYGLNISDNITWEEFRIWFGGEWELTIDTFRDFWLAMIIAFIAIYFMMVGQFKSFRMWLVIMISFLLWFFGVFPWYSILYLLWNNYFSATSMIWVIALAWVVVWNAIILLEYIMILVKREVTLKMSVVNACWTRMKPIFVTSLTTILWATTILWDPVWSWLAFAIITWLFASSLLLLIVLPIFIYDVLLKESVNK